MRSSRLFTVSVCVSMAVCVRGGRVCPGGLCPGVCPGGVCPEVHPQTQTHTPKSRDTHPGSRGTSPGPIGRHPPGPSRRHPRRPRDRQPPTGQTNRCLYIIFPQTSFASCNEAFCLMWGDHGFAVVFCENRSYVPYPESDTTF